MLQLPFGGVNITVLGSTKFKMNIELLPPASDVNYVVDSIFRLLLLSDIVMILHCLSKWPKYPYKLCFVVKLCLLHSQFCYGAENLSPDIGSVKILSRLAIW